MNIIGNLILGISGINGAHPTSLAKGTLGLAAGNASVDAFKNEVILGALADIEAKLVEGRKITAATIKANLPTHYDDAKGMLLAYHRDCSPNAIKTLLKTSLAAVKYQPADTALTDAVKASKSTVLVAELVNDMYPAGGKTLNEDELYRLYLAKVAPLGDPLPAFVTAMLTPQSKAIGDTFSSKNVTAREEKLKKIADLKGFANRYAEDFGAAKVAAAQEAANKAAEKDVVAQSVVAKKDVLPANVAQKVAESSPEAKIFFSAPMTTPVDKALLENLKTSANQANGGSPKIKEFVQEVTKLEVKQNELNEVQSKVAALAAAPVPPPPTTDAKKDGASTPVSVNAVLVPTAQSK